MIISAYFLSTSTMSVQVTLTLVTINRRRTVELSVVSPLVEGDTPQSQCLHLALTLGSLTIEFLPVASQIAGLQAG